MLWERDRGKDNNKILPISTISNTIQEGHMKKKIEMEMIKIVH